MLSTAIVAVPMGQAAAQEEGAQDAGSAPVEAPATPEEERQLQTVVVRGEFIPEPQRQTSQVASFLSAEDLARTGDDNAALALTRLSGLSVVSGRFAYVRGLGDRYSSARLNGSPLPSPEPLRRTVPLDLFPSNILDGASVQKTFSADYPGEFGGGVIDLKTLRIPSGSFLNVKAGVGYNTETTASDGIYVRGGDRDWSGYDDGLRDIPGPLQSYLSSGTRLNSLAPAEIEVVGESLVNSPLSVIQTGELGPNSDYAIDGGKRFEFDGYELGLVGVAGFSESWSTKEATQQRVQGGLLGNDQMSLSSTYEASTNALGSASLIWGDSLLQATGLYVHSTSKEAQINTGFDFNQPGTGQVFNESSGWFERELLFAQLRGEHTLGNFEFDWRGSVAQSTRDAPYERTLNRLLDTDGVPLYSVANNYGIRFSDLTDDVSGLGADLIYANEFANGRVLKLSAGYDYSTTDREYNFLALRFAGGNSLPADVQAARPDYLFSPDNIDPARFVLVEIVSPNDSYRAGLDVVSTYFQGEVDITPYIQVTAGMRYEDADLFVQTYDRFGNLGAAAVNLSEDYWLPAVTGTWNFADDLQLRVGYSETIARPQFRELALSSYFDPETDRNYRGNSGLVDSQLKNYDARLEYYFGRNQFITVAAFKKEIERPIEEVQFSTSTFVFESTFINSPKAEVQGAEFEYRTKFAMPLEAKFFADRDWLFSINYTYTDSEVQAAAGDTIFDPISRSVRDAADFALDGSVLQGTPENIANLQFGWEGEKDQMTLLLGWVDERVLQRGLLQVGAELPDVIEDPGVQLDLVCKRDFSIAGRDLTLSLSGRNLLNQEHREYQNDAVLGETDFNTYDRGTSLSASLTARF
ncbi:MAG: TonB-dependent receptor [Hyphomonas sp.]|nr:TonB-dependent receptor [Hyphomonas sp.]